MRRLIATLLATLAICSGATGANPPSFKRHAVPGYGVSLSLPSSWKAITSQQARTLLGGIDSLTKDNPELASAVAQLQKPDSPMKFLAYDPVPRQGFATNVNVVVTPLPTSIPFGAYSRAILGGLATLPTSGMRSARVQLPGGTALRVTYRLTLNGQNGPYTLATRQYAFLRPTRGVVVTFTTLPALDARYAPTFLASARSVRFS